MLVIKQQFEKSALRVRARASGHARIEGLSDRNAYQKVRPFGQAPYLGG